MTEIAPTRSPTQKDVAQALGLSQATVSRALRHQREVPEAQRRQILAAARKLGYRANASATTLSYIRTGRRPKSVQAELAWINIWPEPKRLRNLPDFDHYWQGASTQALKLGYRLEEFDACQIASPHRLEQILLARGIDGILLPPFASFTWDWGDFHWDRFCVVRMSRTVTQPRVHLVTTDQVANALMAFQEIRARDYERVGMATYEAGPLPHNRVFTYGYLGAQMSLSPGLRLPVFEMPAPSGPQTQRAFERWLKRERPDAILTDSPIADWVREAGYRIPEDIGLASTSVLGTETDAGIYQNPTEIGRVAVLVLATLIHDNDRGIPPIFRQILVEGRWVDGQTLPRRK